MIRTAVFAVLLLAGLSSAEEQAKSGGGGGGGDGYSQQYHYNAYPAQGQGDHGYSGLSIDVSTGLLLAAAGIIVILALCALLNRGHGDGGHGGGGVGGAYRSLNVANLSEKVLNGIERVYETYNKIK